LIDAPDELDRFYLHYLQYMSMSSTPNQLADLLARVAIVLVEPKYPENIGAAARCAMNMGLSRLIVVRREKPDREKMLMMATHKAAHLIEGLELHGELREAVAPFSYIVGTTARHGRQRTAVVTPRVMVERLLPVLPANQVAILFGPEHRGLTNEDLNFCNLLTTIPTAEFSSLNLAQAVAIHCHELYSGLLAATGDDLKPLPRLATSRELEGMYQHVEEMLTAIDFLKNNDDYWMRNIRLFLGRIGLRSKEVRLIRGFCRQFAWYADQKEAAGKTRIATER
jgi:tRNA/rRNA methyltransferase